MSAAASHGPFSLAGQHALVTGGGSGLGFGIAKAFVEAGTRVVLIGRRENALRKAAAQLGEPAVYRVHDITQYTAAKSACLGMVRSLAAELSPRGIRVNGIAPGWIETPMLSQALSNDDERKNRILTRTPMGRFGEPADIGHAAVYLSSGAARFVTGSILVVDGGASVGF